jgi:hypothetical protein
MKLVAIVFSLFLLCSCKSTHWMYLENESGKDALVQVFLSNQAKLRSQDSIVIINSPDLNFKVPISKNYSTHSYSFVLPDKKSAILQNGKGKPDLTGKLVINHIDTIVLGKSERVWFENDDLSTDEALIVIK